MQMVNRKFYWIKLDNYSWLCLVLSYSMINKLDGYQDHNKWCNYTFSDLPEITHKNASLISNAIYLHFWSSASSWLLLEAKKKEIMDKWADGWMEGWMAGKGMDRRMNELKDGWVLKWMDGKMTGWEVNRRRERELD